MTDMTEHDFFVLVTCVLGVCAISTGLVTLITVRIFPENALAEWNSRLVTYAYAFHYVLGIGSGFYVGERVNRWLKRNNPHGRTALHGGTWAALVLFWIVLFFLIGVVSFWGLMHLIGMG